MNTPADWIKDPLPRSLSYPLNRRDIDSLRVAGSPNIDSVSFLAPKRDVVWKPAHNLSVRTIPDPARESSDVVFRMLFAGESQHERTSKVSYLPSRWPPPGSVAVVVFATSTHQRRKIREALHEVGLPRARKWMLELADEGTQRYTDRYFTAYVRGDDALRIEDF